MPGRLFAAKVSRTIMSVLLKTNPKRYRAFEAENNRAINSLVRYRLGTPDTHGAHRGEPNYH